jgi:chemotaxis protein methyltransferase CheR
MHSLPLSPQVFVILSALIEEKTGLHYRPADADVLASKLSPRVIEAGFTSMMDYYYFLRYDAGGEAEIDALIDALVVGETYFFREADQLEALVREVVAPQVAKGHRPRIWCAACASGEEPLTLAMLLDEAGALDKAEIVATDLSPRALERARRGRYGRRSLRSVPARAVGRWLHVEGDTASVSRDLLGAIRWQRLNLIDAAAIDKLGAFDAILCRNVLIYFRDETTRHVVCNLARALTPGGYLLVGASESLMRFATPFRFEERGGAFFYRKLMEGTP